MHANLPDSTQGGEDEVSSPACELEAVFVASYTACMYILIGVGALFQES